MALPVIADVARVALNWSGGPAASPIATNVMHFDAPGMTTVDIKDSFLAHATLDMWNTVFDDGQITSLAITLLDGSPDADVFDTTGTATLVGTAGAQCFPQSCALLKFGTGGGGRSGRGRMFLPWLAENCTTQGQIDGTNTGNVTAAWVTFANDVQADGMTPCVASYLHSTKRDILTINCETPLATQRRRMHR